MNSSGDDNHSEQSPHDEEFSSFTDKEAAHEEHENPLGSEADSKDSSQDKGSEGNSGMLDMLKNMIPPDQMSTFENLRMLFNTMSYDDSSKSDQK
jgi:hypothetical protein